MKSKMWQGVGSASAALLVAIMLTACSSCGDGGGNGDEKFGRVEGVVYLPFEIAAAPPPASGITVNLAGGAYNANRTTGADGRYGFDDVPVGAKTLIFTPTACLADTNVAVTVLEDDTVSVSMTLTGDASGDCLTLPFAGASRMEIDANSNTAVLLYDTSVRPKPALIVVNLTTGAVASVEFDDLANVYDLAFVSGGVVVFNCFKTGSGYYLRLWNISTMMSQRSDIFYTSEPVQIGGHLAVTPNGADVFVTHQTRPSTFSFDGQVFCLNVTTGNYTDADNSSLDGKFAFDSSLVGGSVNWPYGIALDESNFELLVANYSDTVLVAISLSHWGTFSRAANLVAPIPGVRKIPMSTGVAGYRPLFWGFSGDRGVAASPSYGMLAYESEGTTATASLFQPGLSLSSGLHHLAIHSVRGMWYTLVTDPDRPQSVREAIEERSLTTLAKNARFETRFLETPALDPRAFAVNTQTNKLYVAYSNKAIMEVFELQ